MSEAETFTDFEIELNLEGQEAWGGEQRPLVPPGDYNLTVTSFKQETSKSSQQPMIAVTFDVADGEHAGMKVYNNYSLSQKALGRLKSLMLACKTQLDKIVASQFIGQTIRASVVHTTGEAKPDANGNVGEPPVFANVINEQPLEDAPVETKAPTKTPPVMNKPAGAAAKPANGQPRRA